MRRLRDPGSFSVELQIAFACCLWPRAEHQSERLDLLLNKSWNPERLLRILRHHELQAMAWPALQPFASRFPNSFTQGLKAAAAAVLQRNLRLLVESRLLLVDMQKSGIPVVFLKGLPLASQAYGDISFRHGKDLDLLVTPGMLIRAEEVLRGQGYQPAGRSISSLQPGEFARWTQAYKHSLYRHSQRVGVIELHSRMAENFMLLDRLPVGTLDIPIAGCNVTLPGLPEDSGLIYLCAHGATHSWARLKWLADVNALLTKLTSRQREDIIDLAKESHLERPVVQAGLLCQHLFDLPFPASPEAAAGSAAITRWGLFGMTRGDGLSHPERAAGGKAIMTATCLLLRREPRYRIRELARRLFKSGDKEGNLSAWWLVPFSPLKRIFSPLCPVIPRALFHVLSRNQKVQP